MVTHMETEGWSHTWRQTDVMVMGRTLLCTERTDSRLHLMRQLS